MEKMPGAFLMFLFPGSASQKVNFQFWPPAVTTTSATVHGSEKTSVDWPNFKFLVTVGFRTLQFPRFTWTFSMTT